MLLLLFAVVVMVHGHIHSLVKFVEVTKLINSAARGHTLVIIIIIMICLREYYSAFAYFLI